MGGVLRWDENYLILFNGKSSVTKNTYGKSLMHSFHLLGWFMRPWISPNAPYRGIEDVEVRDLWRASVCAAAYILVSQWSCSLFCLARFGNIVGTMYLINWHSFSGSSLACSLRFLVAMFHLFFCSLISCEHCSPPQKGAQENKIASQSAARCLFSLLMSFVCLQ